MTTITHTPPPAAPSWQTLEIMGNRLRLHAGAAETGGRLALVEYHAAPGFPGPARHIHPEFDEVFVVLEGSLTLVQRDDTLIAGAGDSVVVPGSVPHTFANLAPIPCRFLVAMTPGGFEDYFAALAELVASGAPPAAFEELSARFGVVNA